MKLYALQAIVFLVTMTLALTSFTSTGTASSAPAPSDQLSPLDHCQQIGQKLTKKIAVQSGIVTHQMFVCAPGEKKDDFRKQMIFDQVFPASAGIVASV